MRGGVNGGNLVLRSFSLRASLKEKNCRFRGKLKKKKRKTTLLRPHQSSLALALKWLKKQY